MAAERAAAVTARGPEAQKGRTGMRFRVATWYVHDGPLEAHWNAVPPDDKVVTVWPNYYITDPDVIVSWTVVIEAPR